MRIIMGMTMRMIMRMTIRMSMRMIMRLDDGYEDHEAKRQISQTWSKVDHFLLQAPHMGDDHEGDAFLAFT